MHKYVKLLLFFLTLAFMCEGQSIFLNKKDLKRIDSLNQLMHGFTSSNPDSSLLLIQQISQIHLQNGDSVGYLMCEHVTKAQILIKMRKYGEAVIQLQKYLQLVNRWKLNIEPFAYVELGNIYYKFNLLDIAEEYYQKATETKSNVLWVYPVCLSNLGMISLKKGNYARAKKFYLRSYFYRLQIKKDTIGAAYCMLLMAEASRYENKPLLAEEYAKFGIKLLDKPCCNLANNPYENMQFGPSLLTQIWRTRSVLGDTKGMDSMIMFTRTHFQEYAKTRLGINIELTAADEYITHNMWQQAKFCLKRYQEIPSKHRTLEDEVEYTNYQLTIAEGEGRNQEKQKWKSQLLLLKDSLNNTSASNDIAKFTANILESQNNLAKEQQLQEIRKNELIILQEKKAKNWMIGVIILLIIGIFVSYYYYQRANRDKKIISRQNNEKELLIREIHHRVKNNLSIVSGILDLQERKVNNPDINYIFRDAKSRINSMSLVHKSLYEQENLSSIQTKAYFEILFQNIYSAYRPENKTIHFESIIPPIQMNIDTLIPLALITNELLTNSFKYAFPNLDSGKITIDLRQEKSNYYFRYTDDGIGFNPISISKSKSGLGSNLIMGLGKQLGGHFIIEAPEKGVKYVLSFPGI